ncbi:MAG: hypothetical protein R3F62_29440 [Planctomycetota bacterium]
MKKVLLSSLVAVFLAGTTSSACGGMAAILRRILALQEAIAAIQAAQEATPVTSTPTESTPEQPAPEPPPPPPPVFVQAAPDSLELWDARESVAIPEEVAPIELEEQVVIS